MKTMLAHTLERSAADPDGLAILVLHPPDEAEKTLAAFMYLCLRYGLGRTGLLVVA
jgi:hypothetical protein